MDFELFHLFKEIWQPWIFVFNNESVYSKPKICNPWNYEQAHGVNKQHILHVNVYIYASPALFLLLSLAAFLSRPLLTYLKHEHTIF